MQNEVKKDKSTHSRNSLLHHLIATTIRYFNGDAVVLPDSLPLLKVAMEANQDFRKQPTKQFFYTHYYATACTSRVEGCCQMGQGEWVSDGCIL
ncbi:MAG: hypothetical protein JO316_19845 [Abitibacteriaceae bacterium]|nr:hypothetical protein [Abditibacteriaceae bacterium]MBV9867610.1 hypothetical protein [Abditibacteriaceae bacterium]